MYTNTLEANLKLKSSNFCELSSVRFVPSICINRIQRVYYLRVICHKKNIAKYTLSKLQYYLINLPQSLETPKMFLGIICWWANFIIFSSAQHCLTQFLKFNLSGKCRVKILSNIFYMGLPCSLHGQNFITYSALVSIEAKYIPYSFKVRRITQILINIYHPYVDIFHGL